MKNNYNLDLVRKIFWQAKYLPTDLKKAPTEGLLNQLKILRISLSKESHYLSDCSPEYIEASKYKNALKEELSKREHIKRRNKTRYKPSKKETQNNALRSLIKSNKLWTLSELEIKDFYNKYQQKQLIFSFQYKKEIKSYSIHQF